MASLKDLSQELRLKIWAHALVHMPNPSQKEPALLEAISNDEDLRDDYIRAIGLYRFNRNNYKVTSENVDKFYDVKKTPWKKLANIKHITFVFDGEMRDIAVCDHGELSGCPIPLALKRHRCQLRNNFESIIIEVRNVDDYGDLASDLSFISLIQWVLSLALASPKPFRLIFSLARKNWTTDKYLRLISKRVDFQPMLDSNRMKTGTTWIWDGVTSVRN